MQSQLDIRLSPIAGQWYPGDPRRLASSVDGYINAAILPEIPGEVVAVMAPHAGHIYSGPVAGYAFAALRGLTPDLVVVVAPLHDYAPQPLLTTAYAAYETPLGLVPVDHAAVEKLNGLVLAELGYGLTPVRREHEHALEIELPFLQRVFSSGFKLLPLMVRDPDPRMARGLGRALAAVLRERAAVMVASTDLSHFYPQNMAKILDGEVLRRVAMFDPEGVLRAEEEGVGFACGRAALAAVLWAAKDLGADTVQVLHHATSGDVTGDFARVVGYGAAVVTRQKG